MNKGTVKWFNSKKGYGFIKSETDMKDVFIHVTSLQKSGLKRLAEGQKVTFDIYEEDGRVAAQNIALAE